MKLKLAAAVSLICATNAYATDVFINEIHYDNSGGDVGEFVEIAAPLDADLTDWAVVLYNGSNGTSYGEFNLGDYRLTESNGYGFISIYPSSIQNGSPDAIALVNGAGTVVQLLSYEGTMTATNGPAEGVTSTDIGVAEASSTDAGTSLQLSGTGSVYSDFSWADSSAETPSVMNSAQTIGGSVEDTPPSVLSISPADGESNVAVDTNIVISFNEDVAVSAVGTLSCTSEFSVPLTLSGSGRTYTVSPDIDLPAADDCSYVLQASSVVDLDGEPNNLLEGISISFTVAEPAADIDLVINEFLSDPAADLPGDANGDGARNSSQDEFVELVNPGLEALDISGWTISDGVGVRHVFPIDTLIEAGCAVVVFGGGEPTGNFGGALVQTASSGSLGLNNGGDTIAVDNGSGNVTYIYGSEGSNNQSLTLNPDVTGTEYAQHSTLSAAQGALFSPGTKADGSSFAGCTAPDTAPSLVSISPADGELGVATDAVLELVFSEEVMVSQWPALNCSVSGEVALLGNTSGTEFMLSPAVPLDADESCSFSVLASDVTDLDGQSDALTEDISINFATSLIASCPTDGSFDLISSIQGTGFESSFTGTANVKAAVTAVVPGKKGFYIQEELEDYDNNPASSEGIFVFDENEAFIAPAVGDVVYVSGSVSEFFGNTQITLSSAPLVCGNYTVEPTEFSLPVTSSADLESLEGMFVKNAVELTVTNNFTLGRFGEVTLSNGRIFNPNNISLPGSAENAEIIAANALNRILLDDANSAQNPEVLPYPAGGLSANNTLRMGYTVSSVEGVVDYSFSEYRVIPTVTPTIVETNARTSAPDLALGNLTVASLNVLNYFTSIDAGVDFCGPSGNAECRGADDNGTDSNGLTEFDRQKAKTVAALVAMNADIVGLMEIENNGFDANSTVADLVDGVNALMGEGTYAVVEHDGPIGTDAITVALIYKPSVVNLSGASLVLDSSNSISDDDGVLFNDSKNRPSFIQKFALVENGEEIVLSVNHFKSKGSSCGAGDDDTSTGQGNCNLTRTRASLALAAFLEDNFADTPTLIIGDLNAYALEDPITTLTDASGPAYTDLANMFAGSEAYSYSFNGELGYLDHALASPSLVDKVVDATEWHINADEPVVLDYNFEFKSSSQIDSFFAPGPYRMSDHDPVVVSIMLEADALVGDWDNDGDVDINDIRGFMMAVQSRQEIDMAYDLNNDGVVNILDARVLMSMCTRTRCAA